VERQETELEYVGFWLRVWASLIDSVFVLLITVPPMMAVYGANYWQSGDQLVRGPAEFLFSYVLPAVLFVVLWRKLGATPGKMAIGASIVDARTGGAPSVGQCVIRYIGYYVSLLGLFLGYFWVGIDARKQGWHDKMAGTVVVRRRGGTTRPVQFDQAP